MFLSLPIVARYVADRRCSHASKELEAAARTKLESLRSGRKSDSEHAAAGCRRSEDGPFRSSLVLALPVEGPRGSTLRTTVQTEGRIVFSRGTLPFCGKTTTIRHHHRHDHHHRHTHTHHTDLHTACVFACTCVCVYIYMCVCMCVWSTYTRTYVRLAVCTRGVYVPVRVHVCVRACARERVSLSSYRGVNRVSS